MCPNGHLSSLRCSITYKNIGNDKECIACIVLILCQYFELKNRVKKWF